MAEILNESPNENDLILETNPDENISQVSSEQKARPDLTKSVLFHGVVYLGSASITAPRSEEELHKNMAILNEQSNMNIEVTLCVPDNADGVVRLLDPQSEGEISSYLVSQIIFCARGPSSTPLSCCWAFTTSRPSMLLNQQNDKTPSGKLQYEVLYQCQVFRCENQDAIYRILLSFANAFRRTANNQSVNSRRTTSIISNAIQATVAQLQQQTASNSNQLPSNLQIFDGTIKFRCFLDIKEENTDSKGNVTLISAPRPEKNVFNLRKNIRKNVSVTLQQIRGTPLNIERCFGLLLAQGRNVRASDMQLLDLETMGKSDDNRSYGVRGYWNPLARAFKDLIHLNEETSKGARVFLTIALDVVISGISEPVRFVIEAKARITEINKSNDTNSQDISDTIWSSFKKVTPFTEEFDMIVKQVSSKSSHQDQVYEVVQLESKTEAERRAKFERLSSRITNNTGEDDNDDIIISGFGHVSKECDADVLNNWNEILIKWRKNYNERPNGLQILVQKGIPEALRCEVWQLLAGSVKDEKEMIDTYRYLLTKESSSERIIINDLNRTFPAHEYFKEQGGIGQEALYKLSRAYSVRDEEVGYCQGVSFVIATILIHMPEEQAFMLLCKLMEDERYLLRLMYKANFENLQMKFYQLNCLIEENLPDIYAHFYDLKVECHMFASQWFLTLFTAKFPLYVVFRIMDIFLYEGFNAIFAVALSLLKCNQKDLLSLDFEGVMRFFRVNLPKKYLCEDHADELIQAACSMKLNIKKLKRYEKEYLTRRAEEEQKQTPLQRLEVDNKRLTENCMRSEFENEMLALELVNDRIKLKERLHQADDHIETLTRELEATKLIVRQSEELAIRLNEQLQHTREAFRDTCDDLQQAQKSVHDYKQICSQLNNQLDKHKEKYIQKMEFIHTKCCESCKSLIYSPPPSNVSTPERETSNNNLNEDDLPSVIPSDVANRLHRVEIELAEKKLALTQALCDNQELTRKLQRTTSMMSDSDTISISSIRSNNQNSSGSWLSKTVNSIKEATNSSNRTKVN
ncbi:unnamed protein product [Adineta steineri]|nr:unnamed protein product [Adineta steineri]